MPPAVALTVAVPVRIPAVNRPVLEMVPPALATSQTIADCTNTPGVGTTDQPKPGCVGRAASNWSYAVAVNCTEPKRLTVGAAAATAILVSVRLTVTVTLLVTVSPDASWMVTRKRYDPSFENVATVFLAALVPFELNEGAAEP